MALAMWGNRGKSPMAIQGSSGFSVPNIERFNDNEG